MAAQDSLAAFDDNWGNHQIDDAHNCQWRVAKRPVGNVTPEDFAWTVSDIPEPEDGEVLLKPFILGSRR